MSRLMAGTIAMLMPVAPVPMTPADELGSRPALRTLQHIPLREVEQEDAGGASGGGVTVGSTTISGDQTGTGELTLNTALGVNTVKVMGYDSTVRINVKNLETVYYLEDDEGNKYALGVRHDAYFED